ncbi:MAG: hypothetical protein V4696_02050 [Pseudomonadota bacterium]
MVIERLGFFSDHTFAHVPEFDHADNFLHIGCIESRGLTVDALWEIMMSKNSGNALTPVPMTDERLGQESLRSEESHGTSRTMRTFRDPHILGLFANGKVKIRQATP